MLAPDQNVTPLPDRNDTTRGFQRSTSAPRLLAWYLLAQVEAEAGDNQEVYAALRHRTKTGTLLTMETMLASHLLDASIRRSKVDRFLEVLPTYSRAVVLGSSIMADARARSVADMPTGSSLKPVRTDEWTDPSIREATISAILVFALALVCSGKTETFEELRARVFQTADLSIHPSCNLGRTVNRREA